MWIYNTETELYHYGVKGMKWGVRKKRMNPTSGSGTFKASNGMKVAAPKNTYVKVLRKVASNRGVEAYSTASYKNRMGKRHTDTLTNRAETLKGEQRMHKEAQAIREYNAHQKDLKKGTGTKHLDRAIRKNKIDDAYEKVQTAATRKDRFMYNDATRKKAAKYMVDNNMSMADATKKANRVAIRNTAVLLGVYGAYTIKRLNSMR